MAGIAAEELDLPPTPASSSASVDGFEHYRVWPDDHPRDRPAHLQPRGVPYDLLAAVLSAEHGIGIRHGASAPTRSWFGCSG